MRVGPNIAEMFKGLKTNNIKGLLELIREASPAELLMIDDDGTNTFHHLLNRGVSIPTAKYTEDVLCSRNVAGRTLLQAIIAATPWALEEISANLYTNKTLTAKDKAGVTAIHELAGIGSLKFVPKSLLTNKTLLASDTLGFTSFHHAAKHGKFLKMPPEFITEAVLKTKGNEDATPAHLMGNTGEIYSLPPELLTQELLMLRDTRAWTVLHEVAISMGINRMPVKFVTAENMMVQSASLATPMQLVVQTNTYRDLPIYKEKFVNLKDGERVLWLKLIEHHKLAIPPSLELDYSHLQPIGDWKGL